MSCVRLDALTLEGVAAQRPRLVAALAGATDALTLDFAAVRALDSSGVAMLTSLLHDAQAKGCALHAINVHPTIVRSLDVFPAQPRDVDAGAASMVDSAAPSWPQKAASSLWLHYAEGVGQSAATAFYLAGEAIDLLSQLAREAVHAVRRPRRELGTEILAQMESIGVQAVVVVGLIAFLVGITVAMQSAAQLRQFGANVYVVDLVAVAITRELGPLMAAIVVAGRSGAAAAAEMATMTITEEIDALRTMGIDPVRYVVLPKITAITLTQPLLAVLACSIAVFGSFLVTYFYLDISPGTFMARLQTAMELRDVLLGCLKSACFGYLIMLIAAVVGMRTRGGADAVGRSTTASVVAAIFAIIVADAAFSMLFNFNG